MKYIYWAPSCMGKSHACFTFAANNKVSMKYGTYGEGFQIFSGTVIEPEYNKHGFNGKVQVEALQVRKVDTYTTNCTRSKFIAGNPDHPYMPLHRNEAMTEKELLEHRERIPNEHIPDCPFPEHTVRDNRTWLDNLKSAVEDFDPDLICLEEPFPINVTIKYKKYCNVLPYKSENFRQLVFEELTKINVDGMSTRSVFDFLDKRLVLVERQMEYLRLQDIKWEWLDISKWENYKYFGLDNIPNHDMADHKWLSPEIRTDRIDFYYLLAERYIQNRRKRLHEVYPRIKN